MDEIWFDKLNPDEKSEVNIILGDGVKKIQPTFSKILVRQDQGERGRPDSLTFSAT